MWFKKRLSIIAFGDLQSGCFRARVERPLKMLASLGHSVTMTTGNEFPIDPNDYNLVLFNNLIDAPLHEFLADFRHATIVYDVDDALDIVPEFMPMKNRDVSSFDFLLKNADLVTTTTGRLKEYLETNTDAPVTVLPNFLDLSEFSPRKMFGKFRIGFVGSPSHARDIEMLREPIGRLKKEHDIEFVTLGVKSGFGKFYKPVSAKDYPRRIAEMGIDLALAPLEETEFNRYKSAIKFDEMIAVRTPIIGSRVQPFTDLVPDEWLTDDFYTSIKTLVESPEKLEKLMSDQRTWLSERDIRKQATLWEQAYLSA